MSKRITATAAKNRFGDILKMAEAGPVYIVRHGKPQTVVLSSGSYEALLRKARDPQDLRLAALRADFDSLYASMQTARWRSGVDALLASSPVGLNRIAGRGIRKPRA